MEGGKIDDVVQGIVGFFQYLFEVFEGLYDLGFVWFYQLYVGIVFDLVGDVENIVD